MIRRALVPLLSFGALLLGGCITFKEEELAVIRSRGVSPAVYQKLITRQVVTPPEIVELSEKEVPAPLIVKQLDKVGVDYALRQSDVVMLDRARVHFTVLEALREASERYVAHYAPPEFFEQHNLQSGEYLTPPPVRTTGSLLYRQEVLQR